MKKKILCLSTLFFCIIIMFVFVSTTPTNAKTITLRFNTVVKSEGAPGSAGQQAFKKVVEKETKGRVKVEFYYNWTLAKNTEAVIGGLQTRGFEVSDWGIGSLAEYSKAFLPLDVPYLISSRKVAHAVASGEAGRIMINRFAKDTGIKVLYIGDLGFRHITNSKRPIYTPDDLKGLKIRTQPNPLHLQGFKAFGASPTPMSFAELFTALQQGVVDGQENPILNIFMTKIFEVQKYMSLTGHLFNAGAFIMSDEYYKSLPKYARSAIDKASVAAREAVIKEMAASEKVWLNIIKKKCKVNELSNKQIRAFQKIAKKEWPSMAKTIGEDYFNKVRAAIEKGK